MAITRAEVGTGKEQAMSPYYELTRLLERLHRRYLDVIRVDLGQLGFDEVTSAQAMLLLDIGDQDISIRDLIDRGYYMASTATYNIRKLAEMGYIEQNRSPSDRRQIRLRLTDKGRELTTRLQESQMAAAGDDSDPRWAQRLTEASGTLRDLERVWFDYISFK
jgi:DNA-binding MarR family transcriptional regulator